MQDFWGFSKCAWVGNGQYRGTCVGCYWYDVKKFNQEISPTLFFQCWQQPTTHLSTTPEAEGVIGSYEHEFFKDNKFTDNELDAEAISSQLNSIQAKQTTTFTAELNAQLPSMLPIMIARLAMGEDNFRMAA